MPRRRVAVTGLGIIAPVGIGVAECWSNILAARSGIGRITRFDASAFPSQIAGEVKGFDVTQYLSGKEARRYDTFIHYGLVATMEAVRDAGLEGYAGDKERVGVCIGSGIGGLPMIEETHAHFVAGGLRKISPFFVPGSIINMISGLASIHYGYKGPNLGTVSACSTANHRIGEIVAPSSAGGGLTRTAIVTMADLQTLEVEVDVNEAYIAQVRNGQGARITLDAYPDTSFSGRVRQVVPTADRQKATVLVKVSILDRDPRILPEMGAKVVFSAREGGTSVAAPRRVLVPSAAVVQSANGASVWVVENGAVRRVNVDPGTARGERLEIRQGLSGGESLVLEPPAGLKDGTKVEVEGR